jgi:hypothetical protein
MEASEKELSTKSCDTKKIVTWDHHQARKCPMKCIRVDWPMTKHLSTQGGLDPRGGFHCF